MKKRRHWSFSALETFEQCPRKYKLKYHDRLPDPKGPALIRGNEVHAQLETALLAKEPPRERGWLGEVVNRYRKLPKLRVEQAIHLDRQWKPVPPKPGVYVPAKTYVTGKIDVLGYGFLGDWKSGKIRTEKHEDQMHLYATMLASFTGILRWACELIYVDHEHIDPFEIRFDEPGGETLTLAKKRWDERASKIYTEKRWPKQPSRLCDWCPFHVKKGGPCDPQK